jgi:hypothetical protein
LIAAMLPEPSMRTAGFVVVAPVADPVDSVETACTVAGRSSPDGSAIPAKANTKEHCTIGKDWREEGLRSMEVSGEMDLP